MNKHKLIVSDFHLAAGPKGPDGRRNRLEDFFRDEQFIEFLDFFRSNQYAEREVELVFNGDFLNELLVPYRGSHPVRITEEMSLEKVQTIIAGHPEVFDALQRFAASPGGRIVIIPGNHDQALLWPKVQKLLKERINPYIRFFVDAYNFDGVYVTHGHAYEFINHSNPYSFWILDHEGHEVLRLSWGNYFILELISELKLKRPYIDKVKPFRAYLRWAFYNDVRFFFEANARLVAFYLRNRFSHDPLRRREFKIGINRYNEALTHTNLAAEAEKILINTNYHTVVMGHSHKADYVNFGEVGQYFNSGTWLDLISLDISELGRHSNLTFVQIDYVEGQPVSRLRSWRGSHKLVEETILL
ncbi:MAG: metallophosphoesterase [Candidatus Alcyoniella australis]|nr:metallophosphoesterase [Candidatus Alcyoniella australis]